MTSAIYALKAYAQRHYDRLAGRNENEVANALKMAANVSPEELGGAIAHQSCLLVLFHHENEFLMSYLAAWVTFEFGEMDVATVYGKQLIHFEDPESRLVTCFQPFVRVEGER